MIYSNYLAEENRVYVTKYKLPKFGGKTKHTALAASDFLKASSLDKKKTKHYR